jgi:CheY-like chemotaxis protein
MTRPPPELPLSPELRERDERLASLKALAGQLVHDFKNFLAPLLGYVTLIKEEALPGSLISQYATTMENAARKTERIIDRVSLATRRQKYLRRDQVDFAGLIREELEQWLRDVPAKARVAVQARLEPCRLAVDAGSWRRVLQELLSNVRFALATGGTLEVSLAPRRLTAERAAALGVPVPEVLELTFRDDGFGMSAATARRAFEPFFSTRSKTHATGLGLSLVHTVVQSHWGQVELLTAPDVGTTVSIWLPLLPSEATDSEAPLGPRQSAEALRPRAHGTKVLVVDDDPFVVEVIKSDLQHAGLEVVAARDGREGLKLYRRQLQTLALVILDVTLPVMTGIEMAREIRKLNPQVPIVFISGAAEAVQEEALTAVATPPALLLTKPFRLKALLDAVRQFTG